MVQNRALQQGAKKPSFSQAAALWDVPEADTKSPWPRAPRLSSSQTHASQPPLPITQALKELKASCNVHTQGFATIYVDKKGHVNCEVSTALGLRAQDIFSKEFCRTFLGVIKEVHSTEAHQHLPRGDPWDPSIKDRRRHSEAFFPGDGELQTEFGRRERSEPKVKVASNKRRMTAPAIHACDPSYGCFASGDEDGDASDTDAFEGAGEMLRSIRISDEAALEQFYTTRFIQMQQIPCKVINKAWVKIVQPKKQANNPYNGGKARCGQLTVPDWWPREGCRHREPDHINKAERLILLVHILRKLYHYHGRDGKSVSVAELEQSTKECFTSTERHRQAGKWLNEIYDMRRQEERFLEGEIDGNTIFTVVMPDKAPKVTTRRSRAKARARRGKARAPTRLKTASTATPAATHQSPTGLASPIRHLHIQTLKEEPTIDRTRYIIQTDNQRAFTEQGRCSQRGALTSANTSFSSPDDGYSTAQMSPPQAAPQPSYALTQNSPKPAGLGFRQISSNLYGVNEPFPAGQRQNSTENFPQNATRNNGWIPSPLPLAPEYELPLHSSHWSFAPMNEEQHDVLRSHVPFTGTTTGIAQAMVTSPQQVPQMTPTTPFNSGPTHFPRHALGYMPNHPQGGLPDFSNMETDDGSYHDLQ